MDIKSELKEIIRLQFEGRASQSFLERAFAAIDEALNEEESLTAATNRVSRMVSLFIDNDLGKKISETLKVKVDKGFH